MLSKRYCEEFVDGTVQCFRETGFWYTTKGQIIKWAILGSMFGLFMLWFIGGYIHARRRLKKGKPLLAYHRFLVSWQERKRYGQEAPPQSSHFAFYAQNPYDARPTYQQRPDGSWGEVAPPPVYNGADAPPVYAAPQGATKMSPDQDGRRPVEMTSMAPQGADVEQGLPPRPPQKAKATLKGWTERFRK